MFSVTLDSNVSPKKRPFSRGMSEDESLRSIITETEGSTRRLTRSESRGGTLKRRPDSHQSDQDLLMGLPEMLELQASYEEAIQEVRGLEVEREALLFQVDILQDTLQGVEELLAEAQREAGQVNLELEKEKITNQTLEKLVCSLKQEVERLQKERNNGVSAPGDMMDETKLEPEIKNGATSGDKNSSQCESCRRAGGLAGSEKGHVAVKKMVSQSFGRSPSLALDDLDSTDGVHQRPFKEHVEDERDSSPDRNDTDSISAYEDASAETPEQDRLFPADEALPDDSEQTSASSCLADGSEGQNPKDPDGCILS